MMQVRPWMALAMTASPPARPLLLLTLLPRVARFLWRVLTAFLRNRGILLAGGVGYNILLSIVPLFALLVVLLARILDEEQLLGLAGIQAPPLGPAPAEV